MAKYSKKATKIVDEICKTIERYCRFEGRKPNRILVMPDVFNRKTMKREGNIFDKMVSYVDRELSADDAAKQGKTRPKPFCKACVGRGEIVTSTGGPYDSYSSERCKQCGGTGKPGRKAVKRAST